MIDSFDGLESSSARGYWHEVCHPLGDCYRRLQRFDDSERMLDKVNLLFASEAVAAHPVAVRNRILIQNSLAMTNYARGRIDDAHSSLVGLLDRFPFPGSQLEAELRTNLAWMQLELEQTSEAKENFEIALRSFRSLQGDDGNRTAECAAYLARACLLDGDSARAKELLGQALAARENYLARLFRQSSTEREQLAIVQELRIHREVVRWPGVMDTYLELADSLSLDPREQYEVVLKWKGVARRDSVSRFLREGEYTGRERRNELLAQIRKYAWRSPFSELSGDVNLESGDAAELLRLELEVDAIERDALAGMAVKERKAPTVDAILRHLHSNSAWLDLIKISTYRRSADAPSLDDRFHYVGFVVTDEGVKKLNFDLSAAKLDAAAAEFTSALENEKPSNAAGQILTQQVQEPISRLTGDKSVLVVSGDGLLMRVPFGAIKDREGNYWVESTAFGVASSANSLLRQHDSMESKRNEVLLAGFIDYGNGSKASAETRGFRGSIQWDPLNDTAQEIREILVAMRAVGFKPKVLVAGQATEDRLKESLENVGIAHVATHGFFAEQSRRQQAFDVFDLRDQLDSAIICAGANLEIEGNEDQYLTALEVRDLDLSGLQHLTLSACQTGLGHINEGQGLVGLLDAFEKAGTRTMVTSFWPVPSEETRRLMSLYYEQLLSTTQPQFAAQALRQAQLQMISSDDEKYRNPVAWAAWSVAGDAFFSPSDQDDRAE